MWLQNTIKIISCFVWFCNNVFIYCHMSVCLSWNKRVWCGAWELTGAGAVRMSRYWFDMVWYTILPKASNARSVKHDLIYLSDVILFYPVLSYLLCCLFVCRFIPLHLSIYKCIYIYIYIHIKLCTYNYNQWHVITYPSNYLNSTIPSFLVSAHVSATTHIKAWSSHGTILILWLGWAWVWRGEAAI